MSPGLPKTTSAPFVGLAFVGDDTAVVTTSDDGAIVKYLWMKIF